MEITKHTYQNQHITIVEGLIKREEFQTIKETLNKVPDTLMRQVWIDCTHVQNISTTKLCFSDFISKLLELRADNTDVLLFGLNSSTKTMFKLLKTDHLFKMVSTLEEAYLQMGTRQELETEATV
ncbi:STAS domain-containing protein [Pontibacter harenae]|uniref:STAS domain-containing protein n=1 Tax=Pontibacter harenae TaxID=2894083 RepID=UPI001E3D7EC0|nr:STAS domain-containing protein [Pontibacter harenae]MCC9167504.1 STAS domain-containing protein [Pontibacter harenae]